MNLIWHLLKYNLIFGKVKLGFLTLASVVLVGLSYYFSETYLDFGETILQYSLYPIFIIFTGKLNAKSMMLLDIKHLVGLPLTKKQIVFHKSVADIMHYMPMAAVAIWGFNIRFPEYNLFFVIFMVFGLLTLLNFISLEKRIDFTRMQFTKSSYKNWFLYINKYMGTMILIAVGIFLIGFAFVASMNSLLLRQYLFMIGLSGIMIFSYFAALKMLKDETRSYFVFRRDSIRIGAKIALLLSILIPADLLLKSDTQELLKIGQLKKAFTDNIAILEEAKNKRFMLLLVQGKNEEAKKHIQDGKSIPWDDEVMGAYPIHYAAFNGDIELFKMLYELNPSQIDKKGKKKLRTPLFSALKKCHMDIVNFLLDKKVNIDHLDKDGNSATIHAIKHRCYGGAITLANAGANIDIAKKKDGKTARFYLEKSGLGYLIKDDQELTRRVPASSNLN